MCYHGAMQIVVAAVPLLVLAVIVGLIVASVLRTRPIRPRAARPRPAPPRRATKTKLTLHVTREQMDDDLKELIRRS
ncbi:MAG: hypothetical protein JWO66_1031 [Candidatus Eremiobacteraeota bacterium]|nr:hypothetical protein [Candidatus Eremiobacteraeota bacterium]